MMLVCISRASSGWTIVLVLLSGGGRRSRAVRRRDSWVSGVVDGEAFALAVSQVIIAASRDDTLPILTGVRMEIEDDLITFLATDRYRLALRELSWKPATPGISTSALVKAKTLNEVAKTLGGAVDQQGRGAPAGKKLRYVGRTWPGGEAQEPPRSTYWLTMNLPLYSPTAPSAVRKPG